MELLKLLWNNHIINMRTSETDIARIKKIYSNAMFEAVSRVINNNLEFLMDDRLMFDVRLYTEEANNITLNDCIDFVEDRIQ